MKKIELDVKSLERGATQNQNYTVTLKERYGNRCVPIAIGGFEAQAIATAIERIGTHRPLTHDLLKNVVLAFDAEIKEILINDYQEGVFFAQLICLFQGQELQIDSRSSDAIALALRFECPIFTYDFVLEVAGVAIEADNAESTPVETTADAPKGNGKLSTYATDELKRLLAQALADEEYEQAAAIRDEITRREA